MSDCQSTTDHYDLPSNLILWQFQSSVKTEEQYHSRLYRKFSFANFESAMDFMREASRQCISPQNHHPSWQNTYATVEVWLTTHDAGNSVTEKDIRLAECLEKLWLESDSST